MCLAKEKFGILGSLNFWKHFSIIYKQKQTNKKLKTMFSLDMVAQCL